MYKLIRPGKIIITVENDLDSVIDYSVEFYLFIRVRLLNWQLLQIVFHNERLSYDANKLIIFWV